MRCYILAKVKFNKFSFSAKIIKIFDQNFYFKDKNCELATRIFLLNYLHRSKVDPFMIRINKNFDLLYVCESQYRKNYPTIDYKKNLWLYSIDNFEILNRYNGERRLLEIPDASKFVMVTHKNKSDKI